jgi:hypothetical protein
VRQAALILLVLVLILASSCASSPRPGSSVRVFEADAGSPDSSRAMPEGCLLLGVSAPYDQMESERHGEDPYRAERDEAAAAGGNVLLAVSERTVTRPSSDCPSGDRSANCLRGSESWYRVRVERYACTPEALSALAASAVRPRPGEKQAGAARVASSGSPAPAGSPAATPVVQGSPASARSAAPPIAATDALAPDEMKRQLLQMKAEGIGVEVLVAFVRRRRLTRPLSAEEIVLWKKAGIEEQVLVEAAGR